MRSFDLTFPTGDPLIAFGLACINSNQLLFVRFGLASLNKLCALGNEQPSPKFVVVKFHSSPPPLLAKAEANKEKIFAGNPLETLNLFLQAGADRELLTNTAALIANLASLSTILDI